MAADERNHWSFEEATRKIADELRRSIERASQAGPEELVRAVGVDPEQVREWVDSAGEPGTEALSVRGGGPGPRDALRLVRELRDRDWIDSEGAVTLVGRHALGRWLAATERG